MIDIRGFIRKHNGVLSAIGMALIVGLIFWLVSSPRVVGVSATNRQLPVYSVKTDEKKIAMSFDAAWGNEDTGTIIEIMKKYNIRTTFFVVGGWVDKYPESVKALADAGNEIMNHSLTHPHLSSMSADKIAREVNGCADKVEKLTGKRPALFRCPYGEYNDTVISTIKGLGVTPVQWSVDSLDWKGISAEEIQNRVLKNVEPGSIILFHNAAEHTPEALPHIIETLQSQGYEIVPVSELLLPGEYTVDHKGQQIPAD